MGIKTIRQKIAETREIDVLPLNDIKKILLIINPTAGKMKSKSGMFDIVNLFCIYKYIITIFTTVTKGDAINIVKENAGAHDLIVCCGGDGTLNEVITGMMHMKSQIPIGYIPAGTTNDMAKTLNIPKSIKKATHVVLNGQPVYHDIGIFNNTNHFAYVASFGAFSKVSYATPQWLKNRFGHLAYILDGIKSLGDIKPYQLKVTTELIEEEDEFIFGSVTNSTSVGGMFHLNNEDVNLNDGQFEVLLVRNPHNPIELRSILYGLLHRKYDRRYVLFFHADKVEFEFKKKIAWTVDGECAGEMKKASIIKHQNAIKIIR